MFDRRLNQKVDVSNFDTPADFVTTDSIDPTKSVKETKLRELQLFGDKKDTTE